MSDKKEDSAHPEKESEAPLPAAGILNVAMGVQSVGGHPTIQTNTNLIPQQLHPFAHFGMHPMVQQQGLIMASANNSQQQNIHQNNNFGSTDSAAAPAPIPPKKKNKGGKTRHFTDEETGWLLDAMEKHEPIGGAAWRNVLNEYNSNITDPDRMRDKAALQGRFQRLVNHPKGTGDPNCPEEVIRAKRCERKRLEKANIKPIGTKKQKKDDLDNESEDEDTAEMPSNSDSPSKNTRSKTTVTTPAAAAAVNPRKKNPSTIKGKKKPDSSTNMNSTMEGILEVFQASEKEARKRDRDTRRRERRKEKRDAKREDARERRRMATFMTGTQAMTATLVTAITGEQPIQATPQDIAQSLYSEHSSSSNVSSGTSSDSSDGESEESLPPRKRKRKKQYKR